MLKPSMIMYFNPGAEPVEFPIGTTAGAPPKIYRCEPGGFVEGPESYIVPFHRLGRLVPATPEQLAARDAAPVVAEMAPVVEPEPGSQEMLPAVMIPPAKRKKF